MSDRERTVVLAFGRALGDLLRHRNAVEAARRGAISVSKLDRNSRPSRAVQESVINATKDFFLSYYAAVSAMVSLVKRFPSVFDNPPHTKNEKFLEWMVGIALFPDRWDTLRLARDFRTLLDHPAGKQPDEWVTGPDQDGILRAGLYGPAGMTGNIPAGAERISPHAQWPDGTAWIFVAPDEDEVLTLLAVQLNSIVDRIQAERFNPESIPCGWEPPRGQDDPQDGYPTFATRDGVVAQTGPMTPELSPADRKRIDAILAPYIEAMRAHPK
ncbi:hypothetical protein [Microbacterium sp. JZ37]|uniref:hypothetical protein n=1 Tax=Microbacterium sp. JZ37 TaxID=2654193 RepID=UPI002B472A70|nr:hypothetical protein [Microbacterium sp. JZ37]WRH16183.1 hypothetical protein GC092_00710 [Microbacterium sp. JZ37]